METRVNLAAVKRGISEYGEKLAFGGVVLVFLALAWSAINRETLDSAQQPQRLRETAKDVAEHVAHSRFEAKASGVALVDYSSSMKRDVLPPQSFPPGQAINPSIVDPKRKRPQPNLLPAEQARAVSGFGSFALRSEGRGAGQPFPQLGAPGPGGGNRAGANRGKAAGNPAGNRAGAGNRGNRGAGPNNGARQPQQDAVPPRRGFQPGPASTLKPQPWVAVLALVPRSAQEQEYISALRTAAAYDDKKDVPQYVECQVERAEVSSDPGKLEWKFVTAPTDFQRRWENTMPDPAIGLAEGPLMQPLGPLVGMDWGEAVLHPALANLLADKAAAKVEYRLLRVFDFTVESNAKYRYRVRLALKNPNDNTRPEYLEEPASRDVPLVYSDWSEPTAVIGVPGPQRVFAGPIVKPASRRADPLTKVVISSLDTVEGIEAGAEVELTRGSMANKRNVGPINGRDPRNHQIRELRNVDLNSGAVVLDIRGGGSTLPRKDKTLLSPTEVLLMSAVGNMMVRNEFDDHHLFKELALRDPKNQKGKPGQ